MATLQVSWRDRLTFVERTDPIGSEILEVSDAFLERFRAADAEWQAVQDEVGWQIAADAVRRR
jgi:hypothetical protein